MNHDIYICYTEPDKAVAEEICQAIEQQEITCWLNSRNMDMNKSYARSIIEAINNCKCVVVIISNSANKSSQIEYEIDLAYKNKKTIIPFVVENTSINNVLNYYLSSKNRIIAYPNYSIYTKKLLEFVCNLLGKEYSDDNDFLPYISDGFVGIINRKTMELIIPCKYLYATKLKNGYGIVKWGHETLVYDRKGKIYEDYCFSDPHKNNLDWLLNEFWSKRNFYFKSSKYRGIGIYKGLLFKYSCAIVTDHSKKWGILDFKNRENIQFKYDSIQIPHGNKENSYLAASQNNKWGIIDIKGNEIISFKYYLINIYNDGYFVALLNGKLGIIDKNGNEIIDFKYSQIDICKSWDKLGHEHLKDLFENGCVSAFIGEIEYLIENKNGIIIETKIERKESKKEKLEITNNLHTLIDSLIKKLNTYCYKTRIWKLIEHKVFVEIKEYGCDHCKYGLFDLNGKEIIPPIYSVIQDFTNNLFLVRKNNLYGLIKTNGILVVPVIYKEIKLLPNGLIKAYKRTPSFHGISIYNQEGKEIIPCKRGDIELRENNTFETNTYHILNKFAYRESSTFYNCNGEEISFSQFIKAQKHKHSIYIYNNDTYNGIGVFHDDGYCVIPAKYSSLAQFGSDKEELQYFIDNGICRVRKEGYERDYFDHFVDTFGNDSFNEEKTLSPSIINDNFGYEEYYYRKYGYNEIEKIYVTRVEAKYELAYQIVNEFGRVKKNGNWGFVNSLGKEITPFIYANLRDFYQGRAGVCSYEGLWGFVDVDGNEIIKCQFQAVEDFSEGLCKVENDNLWGFIDRKGNTVISCQYEDIRYFSEGLSAAQINKKWGYIDNSNNVIIPFIYDEVSDFKDGISRVKYNEKRIFIDTQGKEYSFSKYNVTSNFSEGLALVIYRQQFGWINKKGDLVIPFKYAHASIFEDGCSIVKRKGKFGVINKEDTELISCKYDKIWKVGYNLFALKQDNQCALSNTNGEVLTEFKYKTIHKFANGLACVKKNNAWGYINEKGEEVIECKYETALGFYCGFGQVISRDSNGKTYSEYIDKEGRTVNSNKCFTNKA